MKEYIIFSETRQWSCINVNCCYGNHYNSSCTLMFVDALVLQLFFKFFYYNSLNVYSLPFSLLYIQSFTFSSPLSPLPVVVGASLSSGTRTRSGPHSSELPSTPHTRYGSVCVHNILQCVCYISSVQSCSLTMSSHMHHVSAMLWSLSACISCAFFVYLCNRPLI